jgi:hypothetical protein
VELPAPEPCRATALRAAVGLGSCSVEAVEAVASDLDEAAGAELEAIGGLCSLLDKSLILQTETTDGDRTPRVAMLETIKSYATKALDAQPAFASAAREHHATYFAQLAVDGAGTEGDQSNDRLAPELDNLAIAWRHCVATNDLARLTELRDGLWPIYERRGWYHALLSLIDDFIAVLAATPESQERWELEVKLLSSRARAITLLRGFGSDAEDAYADALALARPTARCRSGS